MAPAHLFMPKSRLAHILGTAADPTKEALIQRAEHRLQIVKADTRAYVAARLRQIEAMAALTEPEAKAEQARATALALEICEVAAIADLEPVGEAARALYILLTALEPSAWHDAAVKLHIRTLLLIAHTPLPEAETANLLSRLKAVRDHIGVPD